MNKSAQINNLLFTCGILSIFISIVILPYLNEDALELCDENDPIAMYNDCVLPVDKVLDTPSKYHGKEVNVMGVVTWGVERDAIRAKENGIGRAIWLDFDFKHIPKSDVHGQTTIGVVNGVFEQGDSGHFGMFNGVLYNAKIVLEY